jgi:dihydrofolate synthase / folylpolyglutamate synthase
MERKGNGFNLLYNSFVMIRTYDEAVKYLERFIPTPDKKHPGDVGLSRMKLLCELLGNPQFMYKTIHVGGTSGKGSTSTIIASILATKFKTGLHTSPHLVKVNERMKVSGIRNKELGIGKIFNDIIDEELVELINFFVPFIKRVGESEYGNPTYFEITTAIAFLYFAKQKVDIAVIEVGMGGKFDGTNVVKPVVAVLTNVGLDHTEILGDTVEKIADDKVGIIKSNIQVIAGANQQSVRKIIQEKCKRNNAQLSLLGRDFSFEIKNITEKVCVFDYKGKNELKNLSISLLGAHQIENASLALRVIEKLSVIGYQFSVGQINNGLKQAFIPGRLEIIKRNPLVIVDGAHNPEKVKALCKAMKDIFPHRKIISIVAIKQDKNAKEMITQLLNISTEIIFTQYKLKIDTGDIISYPIHELEDMVGQIKHTRFVISKADISKAYLYARERAGDDDLILITGSLYLMGEFKKFQIFNNQ